MKITDYQVFEIHAGWRSWIFIRISSGNTHGWSEISDSNTCNQASIAFLRSLAELVLDTEVDHYIHTLHLLSSKFVQNLNFGALKPLSGIENAFIDLFCKLNRLSAISYLQGFPDNKVPIYWSHFGTTRSRAFKVCELPQLNSYNDILPILEQCQNLGISTVKSNIIIFPPDDDSYVFMPGAFKGYQTAFRYPSREDYSLAITSIDKWIDFISSNSNLNVAIDLNFNIPSLYLPSLSTSSAWYEFDTIDCCKTREYCSHFPVNVCLVTGENALTFDSFKYIIDSPVPVISLDPCWLGSSKTCDFINIAEQHNKFITVHNFNGHLSSFISLAHCSLINNLHYLEFDLDDVPWKDSIFSNYPEIIDGYVYTDNSIYGWGCDLLLDKASPYIV